MKRDPSRKSYITPLLFGIVGTYFGDYLAREALELSYSVETRGLLELVLQEHPRFSRAVVDVGFGAASAYCSTVLIKGICATRSFMSRFTWE